MMQIKVNNLQNKFFLLEIIIGKNNKENSKNKIIISLGMSLIWNRITPSQERSMRLKLLLSKIEESLRKKYHEKFPKDPTLLYDYLNNNHLNDIKELKKNKNIKQDQCDLLFPPNQKLTDSSKFDVTLLVLQLRSFWFKKPPKGKTWNGIEKFFFDHLNIIGSIRNKIQHYAEKNHSEKNFVEIFKEVTPSLIAFGCKSEEIENIKTCKLQRNTFSFREFVIGSISVVVVVFAIYFGYLYVSEHPTQKSFDIQNASPSFFGRESEIEAIHTNLTTKHQYKGVVLHGMSGVGKSQIAKRYCQQFGNYYANNIAWFHSPNAFTIEKSMEDFAELLGFQIQGQKIAGIREQVYKYFSKTKALIVFDDVLNTTDIIPFLPNAFQNNIKVLITSQIASWENHYLKIPIRIFSKETAMKFLRSVVERISEKDTKHLEYIADKLQYHPLALQQAVSYIKGSKFELIDYIRLLNESFDDLMSEPCDEISIDCKPVLKAINLTVTLFQSQSSNDSIKLLHDMAFLDRANIRRGFYKHVYCNISDLKMNRMLKLIEKFSLITITQKDNSSDNFQNKYVEIHSLVQRVIGMNLKLNGLRSYENYVNEFLLKLVDEICPTFFHHLKFTKIHLVSILEKDELAKIVLRSFTYDHFLTFHEIYIYESKERRLKSFQRLSDLAKNNETALNYIKMIFLTVCDSDEAINDFTRLQEYWKDKELLEEYIFIIVGKIEYYSLLNDGKNLSIELKNIKESNILDPLTKRLLLSYAIPLGENVPKDNSFLLRCDKLKVYYYYISFKSEMLVPELALCLLNINKSLEALDIIEEHKIVDIHESQSQTILALKIVSLVFLKKWENINHAIDFSGDYEYIIFFNDIIFNILCSGCNSNIRLFKAFFSERFKTVSKEASKSYYNEVIRQNKSNNDTRTVVLYFNLKMMELYFDQWLPDDQTFMQDFSLILTKLSKQALDQKELQNQICLLHTAVITRHIQDFILRYTDSQTLKKGHNAQTPLNFDNESKMVDFIKHYNGTYSPAALNLSCDSMSFDNAVNAVLMVTITRLTQYILSIEMNSSLFIPKKQDVLFTEYIQENSDAESFDERFLIKKFEELENLKKHFFQNYQTLRLGTVLLKK